jgi:hypothetical protein
VSVKTLMHRARKKLMPFVAEMAGGERADPILKTVVTGGQRGDL